MGYKWCVVPQCENTSVTSPQKLFLCVPTNPQKRKKWLKLARRDPNSIAANSTVFMCEDHFYVEKDIANYLKYKMGFSQKIILTDEAVPSKFHCQEDPKRWLCDAGTSRELFVKRRKREIIKECEEQNITETVQKEENILQKTLNEGLPRTHEWETITDRIVTKDKSVAATNVPHRSKDYKKKRRGRPANKNKVVVEEMKAFPESDFEKFMASLKHEPVKTEEENERESLIFKINKLKLEIENLKELKAIQSLRKTNNLLHIEVLQMRYKQLMETEAPLPSTSADVKGSGFRGRSNPTSSSSTNMDSINIKNVIYNNCSQGSDATSQKPDKPAKSSTSTYDPNFTYIATQLLSFFSDKMDANFATHMDSIKKYTHQIFQNELDSLKSDEEKKVSPIKIKCEWPEKMQSDRDNVKTYVIEKPKVEPRTARKKTTTVPNIEPAAEEPPFQSEDEAVSNSSAVSPVKKKDLKFTFPDIKAKILEYLCGKVKSNVVISAFRRLQKSKAFSMLRQTFDSEHNRLLRVYLFDDGNILVQDMTICNKEFDKALYHSVRYYAIILSAREGEDDEVVIQDQCEYPEVAAKKQLECIPEHNLRSDQNINKMDLIVLEPLKDNVLRPRFKVDTVQDTMINEEFVMVSRSPFVIRPVNNEVVLSYSQLELLKPLVLKALSSNSQLSMPIISIVPNAVRGTILQDFQSQGDSNLYLLKSPNNTQENYKISEIKNVELLANSSKSSINNLGGSGKTIVLGKRKEPEITTPFKKIKLPDKQFDEVISFVNVNDIINANIDAAVKTELKEECIDLSDDEDGTIIIN